MTARAKRAVRVTPGATQDRRGIEVGALQIPGSRPANPAFHDCRSAEHPIGNGAPLLDNLGLEGELSTGQTPSVVRQSTSFRRGGPDERIAARLRGGIQPNVSTSDSFSTLYELEHHRGALEILLLLNLETSATTSRFRQLLRPGPEALGGALRSLLKLDLVETDSVLTFPFAKTFRLTVRGRAILDSPLASWPSVIRR